MNAIVRLALVAFPSVALAACARPQTVTLTSAQAVVAAPPPPAVAPPPAPAAAEEAEDTREPAASPAANGDAKPPAPAEPLSFAALSTQLGNDNAMALDTSSVGDGTSSVPRSHGLAENGYASTTAVHQAVPEHGVRYGGDVRVTGGLSVAGIRQTVHASGDRLRACYERGLANAPRAAGVITVTFAVDANGQVGEVDSASESFDGSVTSCVSQVFAGMTFAPPKNAPAQVTYPVEFTKQ